MKNPLLSLIFFILTSCFALQCKSQRIKSSETIVPVDLRQICRLPDALVESSGIAIEGSNRIWSHEDSGNANKIYCFDTTGNLLRTLTILNVENIDWEDLAVDNDATWYICDAGNNDNKRIDLAVYSIPNPETVSGNNVIAGIINFTLEDQTAFPPPSSNRNFDIEAMIWHDDSLFMFTKDRSNPFTGITKMYVIPDNPGTYIAQLVGSYFIGNTTETGRITSADINHHTGELILLTNKKLVSFTGYPGNRFFDGEVKEYPFTTTPGQNEGIAFVNDHMLYMTEEGSGSNPGNLYEIKLPVITSVDRHQQPESLISIFPNPVIDNIQITSSVKSMVNLEIRDVHGSISGKFIFSSKITLNLGNYLPGIYFFTLITDNKIVTYKVLKL